MPLRNSVLIPFVANAFGEDGQPTNPATTTALSIVLEDLSWWADALSRARADGELPPAAFRAPVAAAQAE
ncbi:MAG TPA: hypothetical protein VID68_11035 [Solirubrobacteraceae bacterium]